MIDKNNLVRKIVGAKNIFMNVFVDLLRVFFNLSTKKIIVFENNYSRSRESRVLLNLFSKHFFIVYCPSSFFDYLRLQSLPRNSNLFSNPDKVVVLPIGIFKKDAYVRYQNKKIPIVPYSINQTLKTIIYGPHPQITSQYQHLFINSAALLNRKRKNVLLIIGNYSIDYKDAVSEYRLLDRFKLFKAIKENFNILTIKNYDDFLEAISDDGKFKIIRLERINQSLYLDAISRVNFVFSPTGITPFSHSIYEICSVGSIPITNIGNFINFDYLNKFPNYNFDSVEKMVETINKLKFISQNDIKKDRYSIFENYQKFCSEDAFKEIIENEPDFFTHFNDHDIHLKQSLISC